MKKLDFYDLKDGQIVYGAVSYRRPLSGFENVPPYDMPVVYEPVVASYVVSKVEHIYERTETENDYFGDVISSETIKCDEMTFFVIPTEKEPNKLWINTSAWNNGGYYISISFNNPKGRVSTVHGPGFNGTLHLTKEDAIEAAAKHVAKQLDDDYKYIKSYKESAKLLRKFSKTNGISCPDISL